MDSRQSLEHSDNPDEETTTTHGWAAETTIRVVLDRFPGTVIAEGSTSNRTTLIHQSVLEAAKSHQHRIFGDRETIDPSFRGYDPLRHTVSAPDTQETTVTKPPEVTVTATTSSPDKVETFQFTRCNECEEDNRDYKGCNHPDDPPTFQIGPINPIPPSYRPIGKHYDSFPKSDDLQVLYEMLRTWALNELFTENVDETAKGIILTTISGNLAAKDAATSNPKAKRASALGSLTWRVNNAIALGLDPSGVARIKPLPTIRMHAHEHELRIIVVNLDGEALAFAPVHEGLIVGMFGGKIGGEVKGEEVEEGEEAEEKEEDWSALEWKTSAMADHLREELCDFKMPSGLD